MIASIGKYYNPAQEYRPDSSLFQRNSDVYVKVGKVLPGKWV